MAYLIYIFLWVIGPLLGFYCGTIGMILGIPLVFFLILNDPEDIEFWKKEEKEAS